jgi:hypothetical protein
MPTQKQFNGKFLALVTLSVVFHLTASKGAAISAPESQMILQKELALIETIHLDTLIVDTLACLDKHDLMRIRDLNHQLKTKVFSKSKCMTSIQAYHSDRITAKGLTSFTLIDMEKGDLRKAIVAMRKHGSGSFSSKIQNKYTWHASKNGLMLIESAFSPEDDLFNKMDSVAKEISEDSSSPELRRTNHVQP